MICDDFDCSLWIDHTLNGERRSPLERPTINLDNTAFYEAAHLALLVARSNGSDIGRNRKSGITKPLYLCSQRVKQILVCCVRYCHYGLQLRFFLSDFLN